ncbi:MAG: mandelate racemase/muconate lactonizing enzyme family protein, partial [Candidatus Parvarchaeota archaeon]
EMFDEFAYPEWVWDIVDAKPKIVDGYEIISDKPGIGINIKEKVKDYIAEEGNKDFNLFSEGWEKRGFR